MAIAGFAELCHGLAEVAGCEVPPAAANEHGAQAVAVTMDGVECVVGHDPQRGEGHVFVITRFGPLPQDDPLKACLALLQTNCLMLGANAPSFGVDPITSDVMLQHASSLNEISPVALHEMIAKFAGIALEWRANHFLPSGEEDGRKAGWQPGLCR